MTTAPLTYNDVLAELRRLGRGTEQLDRALSYYAALGAGVTFSNSGGDTVVSIGGYEMFTSFAPAYDSRTGEKLPEITVDHSDVRLGITRNFDPVNKGDDALFLAHCIGAVVDFNNCDVSYATKSGERRTMKWPVEFSACNACRLAITYAAVDIAADSWQFKPGTHNFTLFF